MQKDNLVVTERENVQSKLQIRQKRLKMVLQLWPNVKKGSMNPLYKKGIKVLEAAFKQVLLLRYSNALRKQDNAVNTYPSDPYTTIVPIIPFVLGPLSAFNTSTSLHFQHIFMPINFHLKVGFLQILINLKTWFFSFFSFYIFLSWMMRGENLIVLCPKWI